VVRSGRMGYCDDAFGDGCVGLCLLCGVYILFLCYLYSWIVGVGRRQVSKLG
jgi:hypothetical protein